MITKETFCAALGQILEQREMCIRDSYYGDERDARTKKSLAKLGPKILCIHGNHEMRPESITHENVG